MGHQEKRRIQRITFEMNVRVSLGDTQVTLSDLSTTGAQIEHASGFTPGGTFLFTIECDDETFRLRAAVTRCRLARSKRTTALRYQCGLSFVDVQETARRQLHDLIARHVEASVVLASRKKSAAALAS